MNITVSIRRIFEDKERSLRGIATITLEDCFAIKGIRIVEGRERLFIAMPAYKHNGKWRDTCHPISSEFRKLLENIVLDEYRASLENDK